MVVFHRVERKFPVEPKSTEFLVAWLGHACRRATVFPVGQVTSCYYDTDDWDCYFESVDGDFEKTKVRLRWYDDLPASGQVTAYVEAKQKSGAATWKRRTPVTLDPELLRAGRFDEALPAPDLQRALATAGIIDKRRLRPAVVITYRRHRFVDRGSGTHVALDREIEAWPVVSSLDPRRTRFPAAVLEVKGSTIELPARFSPLRRWVSVWSSHSKYAMAVEMLRRETRPAGF